MSYTIEDIQTTLPKIIIFECIVKKSLNDLQNVISTVRFSLFTVFNNQPYSKSYSIDLDEPDPDNFVNIRDLTKDDIMEWVKNDVLYNNILLGFCYHVLEQVNKDTYVYNL